MPKIIHAAVLQKKLHNNAPKLSFVCCPESLLQTLPYSPKTKLNRDEAISEKRLWRSFARPKLMKKNEIATEGGNQRGESRTEMMMSNDKRRQSINSRDDELGLRRRCGS
ncbi:unnamed protein product [Vicia faba]|uniref:Uncharacterized protein n=1 Tax=Vicia faba TaxID=3906 RepID=A0AAV0ZS40_VICFA|nr:unnamed protein product [Vicia faba]